jgi:hypothetical protein
MVSTILALARAFNKRLSGLLIDDSAGAGG